MLKENKLKLKKMVSYSASDILSNGAFYIIGIYFSIYLTQVESISIVYAGIIVMIGKVWDAVNDPIMGILTDRTRTKYGRRRPYILAAAIPVLVSYSLLWYSFGMSSEIGKVVYYTIVYLFFCTAYTMFAVPYASLLPDMVRDYGERTQYIGMKYIFGGIGSVTPYFIAQIILGSSYSPKDKGKFLLMGIVLALFFSVPLIITFFGTKENTESLPPPDKITLKDIFNEYKLLLKNSSYVRYILISICTVASCALISGSYFYYLAYVSGKYKLYSILIMVFGAAEIAGFPIIYRLSRKVSKHIPSKVTAPFIIVGLIIAFAVTPFVKHDAILFLIAIFVGFGVSGLKIVPKNMFPDLTDVDELMYGKRREGVCASLSNFISTFMDGISIFIISIILQIFGFRKTPENWDNELMGGPFPQPDSVTIGIIICYAVIPSILTAVALLLARSYKINEKGHKLIKNLIAEKREKGKVEVAPEDKTYLEKVTGVKYDKLWLSTEDDKPLIKV